MTNRESLYDQRQTKRELAEAILEKHDKDFNPPLPTENVIEIDGTQPFEEQFASYQTQLKKFL